MALSCFSACGILELSNRKPLSQTIYEATKRSHGPAYDSENFFGVLSAKWYGQAMAFAAAHKALERARNQAEPLKAYDLLKSHLHDYGVSVEQSATLGEMRQALRAAQQLSLGPRRGNVEEQLSTALGDDFVAWVTTPASASTAYPDSPWTGLSTRQGIFNNPPAWKTVRITQNIHFVGLTGGGLQTVTYEHVSGDSGTLVVGDKLVVAPGKLGQQELVIVLARTDSTFQALFRRPHEANEVAFRRPWPFWMSTTKHSLVVVRHGRARDRVLRDKVRRLLHKLLGATSTWDVVEENSTPGMAGPFLPGVGEPGITPILAATL